MSRGAKGRGQLRIIGGQWRGRKLAFPDIDGLRPTTDRVRETLFNWLAADIHGARCLDLFAGSGALGLEALSRGAASCDFIDSAPRALNQLRSHLQTLGAADRGRCHGGTAVEFLRQQCGPWDIVFIDPPFGQGLVTPCCELLERRRALSPGALVYMETGVGEPIGAPSENWALHREKQAGGVHYCLFVVHPP